MSGERDAWDVVERVLADHRMVPSWQSSKVREGWSIAHCKGCFWIAEPSQASGVPDSEQHRAHLADVLLAELRVTLSDPSP